jgi:small subunit ribosomal protein S2
LASIELKELLEAGVHFGHKTNKWNPKMKPYIFGQRNKIYIIDLQRTLEKFNEACQFIIDLCSKGKTVLFVGTKRQAQDVILEEATRCGMPYVNKRWLGGLLTNFRVVIKGADRLSKLDGILGPEQVQKLSKKEKSRLDKEHFKLEKVLTGIRTMESLPDAIFIVDPKKEKIALNEASKMGIPIIAIADTNCDPESIDFIIPGNDDAIRAIKLIASRVAESILEGRNLFVSLKEEEEAVVEKERLAEEHKMAAISRQREIRKEILARKQREQKSAAGEGERLDKMPEEEKGEEKEVKGTPQKEKKEPSASTDRKKGSPSTKKESE